MPASESLPGGDSISGVTDNWHLIAVYILLTLFGIAISIGLWPNSLIPTPSPDGIGIFVPAFIYLYAFLGALGYIFTSLMANLDEYNEVVERTKLVEIGLRIPAALLLAAGVYLLVDNIISAQSTPKLLAGMAFLVGLYVNVALHALGALADRLLGDSRPPESDQKQ